MATWDSYTQKSTPADADTLMIKDTSGGANKRTPFSGVWNWILTKLTDAVISQLETQNKSIIPAINELNSKSLFPVKYYNADSVTHGSTSNRATIIKRMYDTYFTNKQNSVLFFGIRYSQGYYYFYIMYSVTTRVYVLEVSYYLDAGTMTWQRNTDSGDFEAES